MKNFHELTDRALSTKLNADYTRLAEGRQRFIFEKTLEILNEDGAEIRARQREQAALRQALKEREPEQFSQEARPAPEQETLYGKAVGTVADWIRELPRAGARASQAAAPDFEWIESQMRSAGMFGPGQRSMGTTTREREESVAKRVADIEKYQKDLEAKGIKSWQDIQEPEQEIAALKAYQEQRAKAEGPTRPGEKGPDVPTLQRKYELKAYSEFQERTKGKTSEELRKYYEQNPQQFTADEQFMSNKMATDVVPMEVASERPEGALPKGVQSGSAKTLRDVGENLPTIAAIGGAAALAPGAAAAIARTALPLARVSPETAAQSTRTAVGGAFAAMGAKDAATATDPVQLGLGATMVLPAAGAISRGAQAAGGMPSGPSPIDIFMFGKELSRVRKAQEKFIERAKEQESMAQREVKTGTKEAQDVVWSGRETQGIPKVNPEKIELPSEASARPEWAGQDRGEAGRLSNQEYRALMGQFIDRIWRGDIFTADAMRAAGRRAAVERMTAETPLPPAERNIPAPEFKQQPPVFGEVKPPQTSATLEKKEKEFKKVNVEKLGEREAVEGPSGLSQAVGVAKDVADVPKNVATNMADWIKGKIKEVGAIGKPSLSSPKPSPSIRGRLFSWEKAIERAIQRAKETVGEIKRVGAKEAAATALAASAMILPEPAGLPIASYTPKTAEVIRISEPGAIRPSGRQSPSAQPSVPETKIEPTLPNEGGMNRPVSIPEYEPIAPGEGGMNKPVSLPEYEPVAPKKSPSTWSQMIKDLQKEFETIKTAEPEPAPAPDPAPAPAAEPEPAPAPDPAPAPPASQLTWDEILNKIKSQEKNIEPKPPYVSDAEPVASPETRQAPPPEKLEEPTRREPLPPPSDNTARNVPPIIPITPANRPSQRQQPNIPEPPKDVPPGPPPAGKRQQEREYSPAPVKAPSTKTETPPVAPVTQEKQVSRAPAVVGTTIPSKDTEIEQQNQETQTKQQDKNVDQNVNQIDTSKTETKNVEIQNAINAVAPVAIPAATALTAWLFNNLQTTTSSAGDSSGKLRSNRTTTTGSANIPALPGTAQETEEEEIDTESTKKLKDWNLDWTEIYSKYAKTLSK